MITLPSKPAARHSITETNTATAIITSARGNQRGGTGDRQCGGSSRISRRSAGVRRGASSDAPRSLAVGSG
ncbi:hypothetical protein Cde04nite_19450 [Cellulomonas denverensis]|nr:hypothetical protein Cde04nite_19450 [Cellulomonas denverensis]